jgi:hypothetical protein
MSNPTLSTLALRSDLKSLALVIGLILIVLTGGGSRLARQEEPSETKGPRGKPRGFRFFRERKIMNTKNENETPKETRDARTNPPVSESRDTDATPANDASDFRETPERGYGWGV